MSVFLKCQGRTHLDRHQFTLSSAPLDPFLRLHIRCLGDWTKRLESLIKESLGVPSNNQDELCDLAIPGAQQVKQYLNNIPKDQQLLILTNYNDQSNLSYLSNYQGSQQNEKFVGRSYQDKDFNLAPSLLQINNSSTESEKNPHFKRENAQLVQKQFETPLKSAMAQGRPKTPTKQTRFKLLDTPILEDKQLQVSPYQEQIFLESTNQGNVGMSPLPGGYKPYISVKGKRPKSPINLPVTPQTKQKQQQRQQQQVQQQGFLDTPKLDNGRMSPQPSDLTSHYSNGSSRPQTPIDRPQTPTEQSLTPIAKKFKQKFLESPKSRPGTPTDRPGTPSDRPGTPTDRPQTPTDRPQTPTDRPQIPTDQSLALKAKKFKQKFLESPRRPGTPEQQLTPRAKQFKQKFLESPDSRPATPNEEVQTPQSNQQVQQSPFAQQQQQNGQQQKQRQLYQQQQTPKNNQQQQYAQQSPFGQQQQQNRQEQQQKSPFEQQQSQNGKASDNLKQTDTDKSGFSTSIKQQIGKFLRPNSPYDQRQPQKKEQISETAKQADQYINGQNSNAQQQNSQQEQPKSPFIQQQHNNSYKNQKSNDNNSNNNQDQNVGDQNTPTSPFQIQQKEPSLALAPSLLPQGLQSTQIQLPKAVSVTCQDELSLVGSNSQQQKQKCNPFDSNNPVGSNNSQQKQKYNPFESNTPVQGLQPLGAQVRSSQKIQQIKNSKDQSQAQSSNPDSASFSLQFVRPPSFQERQKQKSTCTPSIQESLNQKNQASQKQASKQGNSRTQSINQEPNSFSFGGNSDSEKKYFKRAYDSQNEHEISPEKLIQQQVLQEKDENTGQYINALQVDAKQNLKNDQLPQPNSINENPQPRKTNVQSNSNSMNRQSKSQSQSNSANQQSQSNSKNGQSQASIINAIMCPNSIIDELQGINADICPNSIIDELEGINADICPNSIIEELQRKNPRDMENKNGKFQNHAGKQNTLENVKQTQLSSFTEQIQNQIKQSESKSQSPLLSSGKKRRFLNSKQSNEDIAVYQNQIFDMSLSHTNDTHQINQNQIFNLTLSQTNRVNQSDQIIDSKQVKIEEVDLSQNNYDQLMNQVTNQQASSSNESMIKTYKGGPQEKITQPWRSYCLDSQEASKAQIQYIPLQVEKPQSNVRAIYQQFLQGGRKTPDSSWHRDKQQRNLFTKPLLTMVNKFQTFMQASHNEDKADRSQGNKTGNKARYEIQQQVDDLLNQSYHQDEGYKIMNGPSNVKIWIDGPYGAPAQNFQNYKILLLVGAGIGITPYASIVRNKLQQLRMPQGQRKDLQDLQAKVYLNWIVRNPGDTQSLRNDIEELNYLDKNKQVDFQIHITGLHQSSDVMSLPIEIAQSVWHKKSGYDIIAGVRNKNKASFGKPDWDKIFTRIQKNHPYTVVGVLFCGPAGLGVEIKKYCRKYSNNDTSKFELVKEKFY